MTAELIIRAIASPAPQGSFFAILVKGRPTVIADNKATKPWRKAVVDAAKGAMRVASWIPLNEALAVEIAFFLDRPKSVRRVFPSTRPDIDKLARSTLDALADARVFVEDGRVVDLTLRKRYCEPGQPAGARIRVVAMADELAVT
jgi:Holliday junction resolvase RusA-like endonuclease